MERSSTHLAGEYFVATELYRIDPVVKVEYQLLKPRKEFGDWYGAVNDGVEP